MICHSKNKFSGSVKKFIELFLHSLRNMPAAATPLPNASERTSNHCSDSRLLKNTHLFIRRKSNHQLAYFLNSFNTWGLDEPNLAAKNFIYSLKHE